MLTLFSLVSVSVIRTRSQRASRPVPGRLPSRDCPALIACSSLAASSGVIVPSSSIFKIRIRSSAVPIIQFLSIVTVRSHAPAPQ
jgi:hypothetical protein